MAVKLTDAQLTLLAKQASWKFDLGIKDARNFNDSVVYTGDGVDDLDGLISRLQSLNGNTAYRLQVDIGSLFSSYVTVSLDDVVALRSKYISIFGTVNKPPYVYNVPLTESTREIKPYVTSGSIIPGFADQLSGTNPALGTPYPVGLKLFEDYQDYGDGRANMVPPRPLNQEQI